MKLITSLIKIRETTKQLYKFKMALSKYITDILQMAIKDTQDLQCHVGAGERVNTKT